MAHHARALGKLVVIVLKTRGRDDPRQGESASQPSTHRSKRILPSSLLLRRTVGCKYILKWNTTSDLSVGWQTLR